MKLKTIMILILTLIFISSSSFASVIHGTIYDMDLEKVKGVVVEINSSPKQRMISTTGNYSFSLPMGEYKITASFDDNGAIQKTEEIISITNEGDYVLDLFLFADIQSEESIGEISGINFQAPFKTTNYLPYFIIILLLVVAILVLITRIIILRKKDNNSIKSESLTDLKDPIIKLLNLIEKSDGRITQKEIRKEIPLSEAKISLMIAELEAKGKIQKIKKGRGNIIISKNK